LSSKREAAIRKGVKEGCNLSQLLFNIYTEHATNESKVYCTGNKVDGVGIQMLRFADGIAIIAQDEINFQRALESLDYILKSNHEMKINSIKVICSKDPENIDIKKVDDALKQVPKFKYLQNIFTEV
jgi:hypothetical protein